MGGALGQLLTVDAAVLSYDERLEVVAAIERTVHALLARQARVLALLHDEPAPLPTGAERGRQWVREELACLLRISHGVAASRLADAAELAHRLPATLDAVEHAAHGLLTDDPLDQHSLDQHSLDQHSLDQHSLDQHSLDQDESGAHDESCGDGGHQPGAVSFWQARALLDAIRPLDDATTARVQARVLPRAGNQTLSQFRAAARRAVLHLDTRQLPQRRAWAVADRFVRLTPAGEGTTWLTALLPDADAATVLTAVQALADSHALPDTTNSPGDTDPRLADQRRADALTAIACATLTGHTATLPTHQGRRPAVQVTVALSTLLTLDNQPGELTGIGPIPAALARALAHDPTGTWRRLITDPHGQLLHTDPRTYRPPAPLRDHITSRDHTCRMPGCTRPAHRCHLDHIQPYDGTNTTPANLHALCPRHHHAKHDAGWTAHRTPDGTTHWTTPTGRHYDRPPHTHPIDHTTSGHDTTGHGTADHGTADHGTADHTSDGRTVPPPAREQARAAGNAIRRE